MEMKTFKEQLQELTDEFQRQKSEIQELRDDVQQHKSEIQQHKSEIQELKSYKSESIQRFKGIRAAFEPTTKFALMESTVYTLVKVEEQHEEWRQKIQHSASSAAGCVLTLLLSGDNDPKLKFDWGQPEIRDFDAASRLVVGLEVLGALVAFIEHEHISKADLEDWPRERNLAAHGGVFLDSLYGSRDSEGGKGVKMEAQDPGDSERGKQVKTAAEVNAMRANFEAERNSLRADIDVEARLEKVVTVLTAKGLKPQRKSKEAALQALNRIFPVPEQSLRQLK
jgi:hypothetical protein